MRPIAVLMLASLSLAACGERTEEAAPTPDQNRWMNQSGDPVTRFVLDGETITINTTLPDGTTARSDQIVPLARGG